MRRTVIIIAIVAFLFGSAAYGSKKPRVSTVPAVSHKKVPRASKHTAGRGEVRRASFTHPFRNRRAKKAVLSGRPRVSPEIAAVADPSAVVDSASIRKPTSFMPSPLRGSYESLVRQNERSETADGLERIEDDEDLDNRIASGMLVPVPVSAALNVNGNLPENRRYCRPWTASFLSDLSRAHAAQFHAPLLVTSAVRTVEYQKRLGRVNGNAAAAEGDIASPHLTGGTIDIAKQGLSRQQIAWMRAHLLPLQEAGKIDVEEEFHQSCFHITVYKSYVGPKPVDSLSVEATATQTRPVQAQTGKDTPRQQQKTGRHKPLHAVPEPAQPEPEQQQPAPALQTKAAAEGL